MHTSASVREGLHLLKRRPKTIQKIVRSKAPLFNVKINTIMEKSKKYTNEPKVKIEDQITTEIYQQIFTLVTKNGQTQIAISNYIVSKMTFDSIAKAKKYIDSKPWELIVNACCCLSEINNKQQSNN